MLKKIEIGVLGLSLVGGLALWIFWPKGLVVRGPMLDFILGNQLETPSEATIKRRFTLPEGFSLGVFARGLTNPRMLETTPAGDLLVSETRAGRVLLLHQDSDGDGASDGRTVLVEGADWPHGLALFGDWLFVAEQTRVQRYPFNAQARRVGTPTTIFEGMPSGGNHRTRTLKVGPDGWLYLTVGSSCNVCEEEEPYRASMVRFRPDGSGLDTYATGLRNTVGFDWNPGDLSLYGTDNGRDLLGDGTPNDELNRLQAGGFYGWPYAYDDRVADPEYGAGHAVEIASSRPPVFGFGAHRAPLGIDFISHAAAPKSLWGRALVALHGSWNSSQLVGYKVISLSFGDGPDGDSTLVTSEDFLTGFLGPDDSGDLSVIGRPVDIEEGLDGAIYVSDDYAGTIWRVGYGGIKVAAPTPASEAEAPTDPGPVIDKAEIDRLSPVGALLFATLGCAECHIQSEAREGVAVKPLNNLASRYDVAGLESLLAAPPGNMPLYDLSNQDRRALAVYLLTVAP